MRNENHTVLRRQGQDAWARAKSPDIEVGLCTRIHQISDAGWWSSTSATPFNHLSTQHHGLYSDTIAPGSFTIIHCLRMVAVDQNILIQRILPFLPFGILVVEFSTMSGRSGSSRG